MGKIKLERGVYMKSLWRKFCLGAACLTLLLAVFSGCAQPTVDSAAPTSDKKTWTVKFAGIPDDCASGYITVNAYDKNGNPVDSVSLGGITPSDTMSKSFELDPDAIELDVLVSASSDYSRRYFTVFDLSKVSGTELRNYYWIDYYYYTIWDEIRYGLNSADVVVSQTGKTIVGDFTDAPFYVCKIENVKGKNIQLVADDSTKNVYFYDTSDVTKLSSIKRSKNVNSVLACDASDGDLYILCAPADYSKPAKVNVRIVDLTGSVPSMKASSFIPEDAVSIDGKAFYLYSDNSKTLKKWVLATDTITESYQFSDNINHIAVDGSMILVAAGSKLYAYDPKTDTPEIKYTSSNIIRNFCQWGSDRIVVFEATSVYSYSGYLGLLDRAQMPYTKKGSDIYAYDVPSGDMLAVTGTGTTPDRIYFGDDNKDFYYATISSDAVASVKYGTATYKTGGLKRLGPASEMTLVSKSGEVFSVAETTPAETALLAIGFDDILSLSNRHLALVSGTDPGTKIDYCLLMTYDLNSPYKPQKKSGLVVYETGVKLLDTPAGIFMVSRQTSSVYMFGFNYCPVHITKIDDVDAVVSQSFSLAGAKPAALNGEKAYSTLGLGSVAGGDR
jgi:hypothetical protein